MYLYCFLRERAYSTAQHNVNAASTLKPDVSLIVINNAYSTFQTYNSFLGVKPRLWHLPVPAYPTPKRR